MALALDASTPTQVTSTTSATLTTASFTAPANALLVAFISFDSGPAGTVRTFTISDTGGLTWTLVGRRSNGTNTPAGTGTDGGVYVFSATTTTSAARTVSATESARSNPEGLQLAVKVFTDTGGAPTVGNVTGFTTASGLPSLSVTTSAANSWVWSVPSDWTQSGLGTAGTSQTLTDEFNPTGSYTGHAWKQNSTTATSGTAVTMNLTAPANQQVNQLAVEIKANAGAAGGAGSVSGAVAWHGSAAGSAVHTGSVSGALLWHGAATGTTTRTGSVSGAIAWHGAATGSAVHTGSVSGHVAWTGSATGSAATGGSVAGHIAWTGSAAGSAVHSGSIAAAVAWHGAATGTTTHTGSASGLFRFAGAATGTTTHTGSVASGISWIGSATGVSAVAKVGSVNGTLTWTASPSGHRMWTFTPPYVLDHALTIEDTYFQKVRLKYGQTLLKFGTSYQQVHNATPELLESADAIYLGGHTYQVSDAEATALTNAGYVVANA